MMQSTQKKSQIISADFIMAVIFYLILVSFFLTFYQSFFVETQKDFVIPSSYLIDQTIEEFEKSPLGSSIFPKISDSMYIESSVLTTFMDKVEYCDNSISLENCNGLTLRYALKDIVRFYDDSVSCFYITQGDSIIFSIGSNSSLLNISSATSCGNNASVTVFPKNNVSISKDFSDILIDKNFYILTDENNKQLDTLTMNLVIGGNRI